MSVCPFIKKGKSVAKKVLQKRCLEKGVSKKGKMPLSSETTLISQTFIFQLKATLIAISRDLQFPCRKRHRNSNQIPTKFQPLSLTRRARKIFEIRKVFLKYSECPKSECSDFGHSNNSSIPKQFRFRTFGWLTSISSNVQIWKFS